VVGFTVPATQVAIMFGLMAVGWVAYRAKWLRTEALHGLTNLLLFLVAPAVTIQAFQRPFDAGRLRTIGIVFVVDLVAFAITIAVARLLMNRRLVPDTAVRKALQFGTVYSNAGFIGIPLTQALLGSDGVFYAVTYVAAYTVYVWTHGISLFGHEHVRASMKVRRVLLNPGIISIALALPLYVLGIHIPSPISDVVGYVAAMNTPLSMIVVGVNLAALSLRTIFSDRLVWLGVFARNLLVPALFVVLLGLLPIDPVARLAILISISTPVGAMLVIFSVRNDQNTQFATRLLCLSTLLCVVTLPLALVVAGRVWS
jgi:malate permease and related proteins